MHRGLHVKHSGWRLALRVPGGPSLCCLPLICGTTCHLQGQGRLKGNVKRCYPLRWNVRYESLMAPSASYKYTHTPTPHLRYLPAKITRQHKCYSLIRCANYRLIHCGFAGFQGWKSWTAVCKKKKVSLQKWAPLLSHYLPECVHK